MTVPYDVMADVLGALDKISRGKVPTVACDEQGLAYSTFVTYTKKYPQLSMLRQEAEDRLYDLMAEALPNIFNHHIYGVEDPKEASVVSSNIKWLLERRRQKAYGAHSTVEHHLSADREVLDALQKAKARAQGVPAILDQTVNELGAALTIDENVIDITPDTENEEDIRSLY